MLWLRLLIVLESLIFLNDVSCVVDDLELKKFLYNWILGLKQFLAKRSIFGSFNQYMDYIYQAMKDLEQLDLRVTY
jgi:hypothetical protein